MDAKVMQEFDKLATKAQEIMERGDELENPTLRVWRQPGDERQPVESVDDAVILIEAWTLSDLMNKFVEWNAFGLEQYEDGEWLEWYNDEGQDIDEVIEERRQR